MRAAVMACALACGGCLVVPKTETTERVLSTDNVDMPPPAAAAMRIEAASVRSQIAVRVFALRACQSVTWENVDIKRETTSDLEVVTPSGGGSSGDAIGVLVFVLVAPVTLAVSGLVTGIIVAASDTTTTHERRKRAVWYHDCSIAGANLPVTLTLPSGVAIELVTGADGRVYLDMPENESNEGDVIVHAGALAPQRVHYCRTCPVVATAKAPTVPSQPEPADRAECLELRKQRMRAAQRADRIEERQRLLLALPVCAAQ